MNIIAKYGFNTVFAYIVILTIALFNIPIISWGCLLLMIIACIQFGKSFIDMSKHWMIISWLYALIIGFGWIPCVYLIAALIGFANPFCWVIIFGGWVFLRGMNQ